MAGEYFTNRAQEVKRIRRAMREPSRLLVYGPRRMGKSSAIHVAGESFRREGGLLVRADLGGATSVTEMTDRLLTSLARQSPSRDSQWLAEWVRALRLELTADSSGAPVLRLRFGPRETRQRQAEDLPGLEEVLNRLDDLAGHRAGGVCVALDEFQRMVDFGPPRAAWELRDLMQGHHNLSYVCAGSEETVIEELTARDGPFHGAFERLFVGEIDPGHFARWIDDRLRSGGLDEVEGIGNAAIQEAGPRTEDVLKLARQVWFRGAARGVLEPDDIRAALSDIVRGDRGVFERLWSHLSPHHRDVLRAVAGGARALTSGEVRRRYGLRSASAVSQAVDTLIGRGLLARRAGRVTFDDPFLGAWVREESPPGL